MSARGNSSGDLKIKGPTGDPVEPEQLGDFYAENRCRKRQLHPDTAQRPLKAFKVKLFINHSPPDDRDDLVDRVGELIASVLNVNSGVAMPDKPAIYV